MKKLKLTQGRVALVDADLFDFLNQWKWCVSFESRGRQKAYALRRQTIDGKSVGFKLHRVVMELPDFKTDPHGRIVHHKNGDGLDCRRANLVVTSQFANMLDAPGFYKNPSSIITCQECGMVTLKFSVCDTCRLSIF